MKRVVGLVGLFIGLVVVAVSVPAGAADKTPTVKEIMGKLNKGPNSLTPTLAKNARWAATAAARITAAIG